MRQALSTGVAVSWQARHREPAERFAIPSRLEACRDLIVDDEIAYMRMTAEDLNGYIRAHSADGIMNDAECRAGDSGARRVVAQHHKEVNRLVVVDGVFEPLLVDRSVGGDDPGNVRVAGEVIQKAEAHDTETVLRGEVAILLADVLELVSRWV